MKKHPIARPLGPHMGFVISNADLHSVLVGVVFYIIFYCIDLQRAKDGTHVFDAKCRYVFVV